MFGRIRRFVWNNFGKIIVGSLAVPVILRMSAFCAKKYLEYQAMRTHVAVQRFKKQQMFEMIEDSYKKTFQQWYEVMKDTISRKFDCKLYYELLKNETGNRMEHWQELKVCAFANILATVHGSAMLSVLLHIQLYVVSGLMFKQLEKAIPGVDTDFGGGGDATQSARKITEDIQQDYMILTRYLCTEGIGRYCNVLNEKCRLFVENLSLKRRFTVTELQEIFSNIQRHRLKTDGSLELAHVPCERYNDVSHNKQDYCPITEAWQYMFSEEMKVRFLYFPEAYARPVDQHEAFLRNLIGEAFDLLNNDDSRTLLKFLSVQGLSHYLDIVSLMMDYGHEEPSTSAEAQAHAHDLRRERSAPLAKLIPKLNSLVRIPFCQDRWVALLLQNESLQSFSANVYESYSSRDFDYVA